jgi:type IV pilus assembly protein PilN
MYSLDINLLNERTGNQTGKESGFSSESTFATAPKYGKAPIFVGAGVAVLTLLAAGGGWLWTNQQTAQLEVKQKDLDAKLGSLKIQEARLQQVTAQISQITAESKSLASVFDRVQPLSAVLQDLRESIPQGIQIDNILQQEVKADAATTPTPAPSPASGGLLNKISTPPNPEAKPSPSASPTTPTPATATAATPTTGTTATAANTNTAPKTSTTLTDAPTTKLVISGKAKSFDEVNNFILTLKQSAFFDPDDIQLINADLLPAQVLERIDSNGRPISSTENEPQLVLPKLVRYSISTSLKRVPSGDLIRELERKGAVGLVSRLKTLQQQQGIKP